MEGATAYSLANAIAAEETQGNAHESFKGFRTFEILKRVVANRFL